MSTNRTYSRSIVLQVFEFLPVDIPVQLEIQFKRDGRSSNRRYDHVIMSELSPYKLHKPMESTLQTLQTVNLGMEPPRIASGPNV